MSIVPYPKAYVCPRCKSPIQEEDMYGGSWCCSSCNEEGEEWQLNKIRNKMKQIFLIFIAAAMLVSCKKQESSDSTPPTTMLYRLRVDNNLETSTYSVTQVVRSGSNSSFDKCEKEEDGKESEACYCKKYPKDSKCKALPVQLEYFLVSSSNQKTIFEWKTSYEENLKQFQIEVSSDEGKTYSSYGSPILPKGAGVYRITR